MRKINLILLAVLMISLFSCAEESTSPTSGNPDLGIETGQYFPAKEGSYWKYEINYQGNVQTTTNTVIGTEEMNGKEWVVIDSDYPEQENSYMRYENGEYYYLFPESKTQFTENVELKYIDESAEPGDSWVVPTTVIVEGSYETMSAPYTITYVEKLDSYEVNGKTYKNVIAMNLNLEVEFQGHKLMSLDQTYYHAAEIGIIQAEINQQGIYFKQGLVDYEI